MEKIDLNKSLYELTEEHPGLIPVLVDLGFAGVAHAEMRSTHGKEMTITAGVEKFGLDMDEVVGILRENGYEAGGAL